jgi:hypothetical protein
VTCYICGPTANSGVTGEGAYGLEISSPNGSNPWGRAGRQIAIDELRAEAPYVPLPSSDLANVGDVGTVWVWDHTSDATVPENHVAAAVYYPTSGIELLWARGRLDYSTLESRTIDGVRAMLIPREYTQLPLSTLRLPVGTGEVLTLEGDVSMSQLIDVAKTLSPSPGDAEPQ